MGSDLPFFPAVRNPPLRDIADASGTEPLNPLPGDTNAPGVIMSAGLTLDF